MWMKNKENCSEEVEDQAFDEHDKIWVMMMIKD